MYLPPTSTPPPPPHKLKIIYSYNKYISQLMYRIVMYMLRYFVYSDQNYWIIYCQTTTVWCYPRTELVSTYNLSRDGRISYIVIMCYVYNHQLCQLYNSKSLNLFTSYCEYVIKALWWGKQTDIMSKHLKIIRNKYKLIM